MPGLFRKTKEPGTIETKQNQISIIPRTPDALMKYPIIESEKVFIAEFFAHMNAKNLDCALVAFERMSTGVLNVLYRDCQVGRIKLHGRKTSMQILTPVDVKWFTNEPIGFYIGKLDYWVRYIDRHLRRT